MNPKLIMSTTMNFEERGVWNRMKSELKDHNSYNVRKQFYPHNMEGWEKEHNEMEQEYRAQIEEMIKTRVKFEMEETLRENELEAASALVQLNKRSVQKRKREERNKTEVNVNTVVRRSSRISKNKK
jgi:hypothetical protein